MELKYPKLKRINAESKVEKYIDINRKTIIQLQMDSKEAFETGFF